MNHKDYGQIVIIVTSHRQTTLTNFGQTIYYFIPTGRQQGVVHIISRAHLSRGIIDKICDYGPRDAVTEQEFTIEIIAICVPVVGIIKLS